MSLSSLCLLQKFVLAVFHKIHKLFTKYLSRADFLNISGTTMRPSKDQVRERVHKKSTQKPNGMRNYRVVDIWTGLHQFQAKQGRDIEISIFLKSWRVRGQNCARAHNTCT